MAEVRILSYNVRSLRDDSATLCRLIRDQNPDVVVVQEAPHFLRWRSKCAAFARRCGLVYVAGGRIAGDNLLLAAVRASASQDSVVERRVPRPPVRPIAGIAAAVFCVGGVRFGVVGAHLGLTAAERRVEVAEVIDVAAALDVPHAIVAGDLNEEPGDRSWRALATAGFGDPAPDADDPTFPSTSPHKRIDAILTTEGVKCSTYGVPSARRTDPVLAGDYARASDHLPVLAVLEIPPH